MSTRAHDLAVHGTLCALAALVAAVPARADDDPVAAALAKLGIRALPPSPAVDFELPRLTGGEASLSDSKGRWVVLTFFATWCGPCRSEMPSLERLWTRAREKGVDVIGVAIDGPSDAVKQFAAALSLTFPILVDEEGTASEAYRAASVPVTYIVDPRGQIVGVARGARDWSGAVSVMEELTRARPGDPNATSVYAGRGEQVELPSTLVPPTATVALADTAPRAGRPFDLDVRVSWAGTFDDYLLLPPEVHLPEGVAALNTSATTSSRDGAAVVTYHLRLVSAAPGSYALDPVELRYTPRGETQPVATRMAGPTVAVAPYTLLGLRPWTWLWSLAGVVGVGGAARAFGAWRRRRGARARPVADDATSRATALLETARRQRLEGDLAGFVEGLIRLESELGADATDPAAARLLEQIRYGGATPSDEELNQWLRRLERRLGERTQGPSAAGKARIRMAQTPE
jgi:peroxiredoxin